MILLAPFLLAFPLAERVELRTEDKFLVVGEFHAPKGLSKGARAPAVLLLHDAKGSRADVATIAEALAASKIGALRIDLRGHGESKTSEGSKEPYDFKMADFKGDKPFLKMHRDLRAAIEHLQGRDDVDPETLGILGLGSGGSLAIHFAAGEEKLRAVVAVCPPGVSDRGFDLAQDLRKVGARQVLVVCDKTGEPLAQDLKKFAALATDAKPVEIR
ncbi:MAG TPA: alpha/beta fold hydrolase, partial [Planctomycetota bacterium]|nr:alpha/beta fold hydrolase [Planctomycetota bacterium]